MQTQARQPAARAVSQQEAVRERRGRDGDGVGGFVHGGLPRAARELAAVERVHPVAGVRSGGTLVRVYGSGFVGDAAAVCAASVSFR